MAESSDSGLKRGEKMMELGDNNNNKREKLPHELVVDILSRLPAVHLWPLRCVCKPWFRLIARDPKFAKSIFDRSIQLKSNSSIIARSEGKCDFYLATDHTQCDKAIQLKHLPFLTDQEDFQRCPVYGICNGMLCIPHPDKNEVYIWNPLTNDHITIPCPPTPLQSSDNRPSTLFGFGFLQSTNEYKVIRLSGELNWGKLEYHTQISMYTLGGGDSSWRTVKDDMPYGVTFTGLPCPQINGFVYWLARKDGEWPVGTILAFDMKDELLYEIDPPINLRAYGFRSDLTGIQELGGLLSLFSAINEQDVHIWTMTMKLNGGGYFWKKLFKIGKPEVVGNFSLLIPLGVVARSGDVILVKNSMGLITYDSDTKSINHLNEFGFPIGIAHTYFRSIISPRVISGARQIMA